MTATPSGGFSNKSTIRPPRSPPPELPDEPEPLDDHPLDEPDRELPLLLLLLEDELPL
ncbi:MAG: hypothetical protein AMXMBFR56_44380 [Polyangiaceae bacterium]